MGYLTTITIHNDALECFKEQPEQFAKAIFGGIEKAWRTGIQENVPFSSYANYITVEPSRHADDITMYLHWGNTLLNIGAYTKDFTALANNRPQLAKEILEIAKNEIKIAETQLKNILKKKKQ